MARKKRVVKNTTPIIINEEEMFLKFNIYAIEQLDKAGIDLTKFGQEAVIKIEDIITILHCGLLTYDPELTRDELAMIIDLDDMEYIAGKITEALNSKKGIEPKN